MPFGLQWFGVGGLATMLAGLVLYARWPRRDPWLGPVFRYELTKLARRGRQPWFRAAYVGFLLAALFGLYVHDFGEDALFSLAPGGVTRDRDLTARFAEKYLFLFLFAQTVVVVAITPAVVGGAVNGEKDTGTFDLLRASPLSNRELALGSLAAGLVSVGSVVLAGVPVLALTLLFGGVDIVVLASGCAVTAVSALGLGSYTAWMATTRARLGDVLLTVYSVTGASAVIGLCLGWVPGVGVASPFSTQVYMLVAAAPAGPCGFDYWVNVGGFLGVHTLLAVGFMVRAVREIRRPAAWDSLDPVKQKSATPQRKEGAKKAVPAPDDKQPRPVHVRRMFVVSPLEDGEDPLRWKDRYFGGRPGGVEEGVAEGCGLFAAGIAAVTFGSWLVVASIGVLAEGWNPGLAVNPPVRVIAVGGLLLAGIAGGVSATGAVARERERNALEPLFTLPVGRVAILRSKWMAAAERAGPWAATAGSVALIGLVTGAVQPIGLAAAATLAVGSIWFAISFGLWLSVRAGTAAAAGGRLVVGMLVAWLAPLLVALWMPEEVERMAAAVSPPFGLWMTLFDWNVDWVKAGSPAVVGALVGAGGYVVVAAFFWRDACRRFRQEGRDG